MQKQNLQLSKHREKKLNLHMISFENTEIAFKSKSNLDLNRAYWLFKIIGSPSMVKFGKCVTPFALKIHLPIRGIIKNTIFKQFCGGETINECDRQIAALAKYGVGTILDYSVEGKTSDEDFEATTKEIIATIVKGKASNSIPFAVFKTSGIATFSLLERANDDPSKLSEADKTELNKVIARVERICEAAYNANISVFIDAEETWIQDTIDRISVIMMLKYNAKSAIVFNTVQMYRHDRLAHLKTAIDHANKANIHYGVKLVRGAYMEKERKRAQEKGYPSPIQPNKEASDKDYDLALSFCIENISNLAVCAGTHNEQSSIFLSDLMAKHNIEANDKRIYFAQLLGMSDHISFNLASNQNNVAKYVPYGPINEVLPYLLRRADENTSVAGQTSRELNLIMKERKRRKIS